MFDSSDALLPDKHIILDFMDFLFLYFSPHYLIGWYKKIVTIEPYVCRFVEVSDTYDPTFLCIAWRWEY